MTIMVYLRSGTINIYEGIDRIQKGEYELTLLDTAPWTEVNLSLSDVLKLEVIL